MAIARGQEILALWSNILIGTKKDAATYMAARHIWKAGASAENNSGRALRHLSELGQLDTIKDVVFRWHGCRSEWSEHAQELTRDLIKILSRFPESQVRRETYAKGINRRADALVLIRREQQAACIWLETVVTETESSINAKREEVQNWPGALEFFSLQFAVEVPSFTFVTSADLATILKD